jgi:hypothetical protein
MMKIDKDILANKGIPLVERHAYSTIERESVDGKRLYATPDGRRVPSVTTILSQTKDMTHLHAWRKRVGESEAQRIATESANIGTVMHKSLERHVLGQDRTPGSNLIQQKAHEMANVIIEHGLKGVDEVWGSEINLYYPELYAGTTDLVGVYNGAPAILDFKQSRRLKKKNGWRTIIYSWSHMQKHTINSTAQTYAQAGCSYAHRPTSINPLKLTTTTSGQIVGIAE